MSAATLYEHEDGRYALALENESPAFTHGDPKWHRVGPVDISALAIHKASASEQVIAREIYWHNPENGQVWSDVDVRFDGKDTTGWTRIVIPTAALTSAPAEPHKGFVLVPTEPTPAMLYALWQHRDAMRGQSENKIARESYRAMLDAAPAETPPAAGAIDARGQNFDVFDERDIELSSKQVREIEALAPPEEPPAAAGAIDARGQEATCQGCGGSGVDGDADDYGRTIDIECVACKGTGRDHDGWQAAIERLELVFQKSVVGMVTAEYATGYTEALSHLRRALASRHEPPAAAGEALAVASAEGRWIEQTRHLNCPVCGGSGHVDDIVPSGDATRRALLELVMLKEMKDKWEAEELSGFAYKSTDNHRIHNEQRANYLRRQPVAWDAARAALASRAAPQASGDEALLSIYEQRAVLADLMGLECLINYHDCCEVEGDAMEPGMGAGNARRALELLKLGREIIARDPELWTAEQRQAFVLRHSERASLKAAQPIEREDGK